jgi:hypothetical protein
MRAKITSSGGSQNYFPRNVEKSVFPSTFASRLNATRVLKAVMASVVVLLF